MTVTVSSEADLPEAARKLLEALGNRRHIALDGPMGAGKTTLTTALCKELGTTDPASSPTFSIINEYGRPGAPCVFHFDFYRIESEAEALDLGLDEYFDSPSPCIMEWAGNVLPLLPDDTVTVTISVNPDGSRTLSIPDNSQ